MLTDDRKELHRLVRNGEYEFPQECANCGATDGLHIHHIVPLSLGGTNRRTNLCVLCEECHGKVHGFRLENHAKMVIEGKKRVRSAGKWAAGSIPYGYKAGRIRGEVEINDSEAHVIRVLFKWRYIDEMSLSHIQTALRLAGIKSRKSHGWSTSTLRGILGSSVVFGGNHFNVSFPPIVEGKYRGIVERFTEKYGGRYVPQVKRTMSELRTLAEDAFLITDKYKTA